MQGVLFLEHKALTGTDLLLLSSERYVEVFVLSVIISQLGKLSCNTLERFFTINYLKAI